MKNIKKIAISTLILSISGFAYADSTYNHTLGETRGTHVQHSKGQTLDDSRINTHVGLLLAQNPELAHYKIQSYVNEGSVTLSGTVANEQDFANAVAITKSVQGVKEVYTKHLHIKYSKQP
jgi:osmotically-inducible protein OsmY